MIEREKEGKGGRGREGEKRPLHNKVATTKFYPNLRHPNSNMVINSSKPRDNMLASFREYFWGCSFIQ